MEITVEELQKKFETLPEDLKWAIMGANVDDNIIDIGQMQGLNVAQMGQLSLETYMVMLGFTPTDDFEKSVQGSMKFPEEKTRAIVNAVNEKILKKIRGKMEGNYEKTPTVKDILEMPIKMNEVENTILRHDTEEEKKNNTKILNSAGIKIIPTGAHPILTQKLTGSVQMPTVKTEHTVDNLTKTAPAAPLPTSTTYPKNDDPYRMKPE